MNFNQKLIAILAAMTALLAAITGFWDQAQRLIDHMPPSCQVWSGFPWCTWLDSDDPIREISKMLGGTR